jgi:hypothetical protein
MTWIGFVSTLLYVTFSKQYFCCRSMIESLIPATLFTNHIALPSLSSKINFTASVACSALAAASCKSLPSYW